MISRQQRTAAPSLQTASHNNSAAIDSGGGERQQLGNSVTQPEKRNERKSLAYTPFFSFFEKTMMGYKLFSTGKNQHKSVHFFTEKNRENATVLSCLPIDNFNLTRKTNKQILNKFYCGIKKSPNSKNHKFFRQIVMFVQIWVSNQCIFTKKCHILKI